MLRAVVQERAAREGRVFVAPYDDPYTIAGQGTIGTEILRQVKRERGRPAHRRLLPGLFNVGLA
jgi:threonine dehydratase